MASPDIIRYARVRIDLSRKRGIDSEYASNFMGSPELRDIPPQDLPQSVLWVPDGNRRFGRDRRISAEKAYEMGADNLISHLDVLSRDEIPTKTSIGWGLSVDNWNRSTDELSALMTIMRRKIPEIERIIDRNGGRFLLVGPHRIREDKAALIPVYPELMEDFFRLEEKTRSSQGKIIGVAFDFGGKDQDIRTHKAAYVDGFKEGYKAATTLKPNECVDVIDHESIWAYRDTGGLLRGVQLGMRTGEDFDAVGSNMVMVHKSDIGWPDGEKTYWAFYKHTFPLHTLKHTAQGFRAYALKDKRQGR